MRLLFTALALLLQFAMPAHAQSERPWTGFRPVRDLVQLKWTYGSVFTIYQPEGRLETVIDMAHSQKVPYPDDGKHLIQLVQYGTCKLQEIQFCPILSSSGAGTTFLFRDQGTLVTVLHNVQTWIYFAKKFNPNLNVDKLSLPTFVTDADGNVIVNPLDRQQRIHLAMRNPSVGLFARRYSDFSSRDDRVYISASEYVELSVTPPLRGRPLQPADKNDDQTLLIIGFPEKTDVYQKAGGGDSDGKDLYASIVKLNPIPLPTDWPGIEMIGPVVPGNSGSPVLNQSNQVVGVAIAGKCEIEQGDCPVKDGLPVISSAALTINKNRLTSAWNLISKQPGTPLP